MIKLCKKDIEQILDLKEKRGVYLEGNILKLIESEDDIFSQYLEEAKERDKTNRKKRLEVTKKVQEQNADLHKANEENQSLMNELREALNQTQSSKEELEVANADLLDWKDKNEAIKEDLRIALESAEKSKIEAESAKKSAENDLDVLQKKTQYELINTIVRIALFVIVGVGVTTTGLYIFSLIIEKDTQIIGSTWANMFGILLTNAFSIVGTIMGVKYATRDKEE
jgi:flagellar biosynthesis GTPase FlhF